METIKINPVIYDSAPAESGRLKIEMDTYSLLNKLDISYLRIDHEEAATIEACREVEAFLETEICKNLFLCNTQKTAFYLLMIPGDKRFKTKDLSKQIGSARLSFAGGEYMERLINIKPGSLSVLSLMNDNDKRVQLLIDEDILKNEFFGCHPCLNTSSLKLKTFDILNKFLPYTGHIPTFVRL